MAGGDVPWWGVVSVHEVARHRRMELRPLAEVLRRYGDIGQQRWAARRAKQQLGDRLPEQFHDVVASAVDFADPDITGIREPAPGHKPRTRPDRDDGRPIAS